MVEPLQSERSIRTNRDARSVEAARSSGRSDASISIDSVAASDAHGPNYPRIGSNLDTMPPQVLGEILRRVARPLPGFIESTRQLELMAVASANRSLRASEVAQSFAVEARAQLLRKLPEPVRDGEFEALILRVRRLPHDEVRLRPLSGLAKALHASVNSDFFAAYLLIEMRALAPEFRVRALAAFAQNIDALSFHNRMTLGVHPIAEEIARLEPDHKAPLLGALAENLHRVEDPEDILRTIVLTLNAAVTCDIVDRRAILSNLASQLHYVDLQQRAAVAALLRDASSPLPVDHQVPILRVSLERLSGANELGLAEAWRHALHLLNTRPDVAESLAPVLARRLRNIPDAELRRAGYASLSSGLTEPLEAGRSIDVRCALIEELLGQIEHLDQADVYPEFAKLAAAVTHLPHTHVAGPACELARTLATLSTLDAPVDPPHIFKQTYRALQALVPHLPSSEAAALLHSLAEIIPVFPADEVLGDDGGPNDAEAAEWVFHQLDSVDAQDSALPLQSVVKLLGWWQAQDVPALLQNSLMALERVPPGLREPTISELFRNFPEFPEHAKMVTAGRLLTYAEQLPSRQRTQVVIAAMGCYDDMPAQGKMAVVRDCISALASVDAVDLPSAIAAASGLSVNSTHAQYLLQGVTKLAGRLPVALLLPSLRHIGDMMREILPEQLPRHIAAYCGLVERLPTQEMRSELFADLAAKLEAGLPSNRMDEFRRAACAHALVTSDCNPQTIVELLDRTLPRATRAQQLAYVPYRRAITALRDET